MQLFSILFEIQIIYNVTLIYTYIECIVLFQACLNLLDTGAREALNDVINKVLRKVSIQMDTKVEELDDTLIA